MRTNWKGRQRLYRTVVAGGLGVCLLVNLLLARLHHDATATTANFMQPVFFFSGFYQESKVTTTAGMAERFSSNSTMDVKSYMRSVVATTELANRNYSPSFQYDNDYNNDYSNNIPKWMQQYFTWHKTQRSLLNATNCNDFKYFVMICREKDKCGGTADRLKPFLLMLLMAYQTQRIFLITWEQPCRLEEFLIPPPIVGLDWRVPGYLRPVIARNRRPSTTLTRLIRSMNYTKVSSLNVRYQSYDIGMDYYNQYRPRDDDEDEDHSHTFHQVYPHAWRMLFTPAPPIADRIQRSLKKLQLVPGRYIGAHVRAFRGVTTRNPATIRNLTMLALSCISQVWNHHPATDEDTTTRGSTLDEVENMPIFFASDSSLAVETALDFGTRQNATIVARPPGKQESESETSSLKNPLHLERSATSRSEAKDPSAYYDTFVDLYLLSMSRCVSYNIGGFGHWASLLSYNSSCHFRYSQISVCEWRTPKRRRKR